MGCVTSVAVAPSKDPQDLEQPAQAQQQQQQQEGSGRRDGAPQRQEQGNVDATLSKPDGAQAAAEEEAEEEEEEEEEEEGPEPEPEPKPPKHIGPTREGASYTVTRKLGEGSFGSVKLAVRDGDGEHFATKIYRKERLRRKRMGWGRRSALDKVGCQPASQPASRRHYLLHRSNRYHTDMPSPTACAAACNPARPASL
jgi:hypothetical protein